MISVMTVYIEYVIIDNIVVTALIIYFTLKAMRFKINKFRVILTTVLGTAIAALLPLLNIPAAFTIVIKFFTGFFLTAFIANYKRFLEYMKTTGIFFAVTFAAGGACFGVLYLIEGDIQKAITMGYEKVPIGVIAGALAAGFFLIKFAISRLKRLKHKASFYYEVRLYLGGESVALRAYLDSGNLLYDRSGNPVVVVNNDAIGALIAGNILSGRKTKMENLDYSTVNGVSSMKVFKPDKIEVYSDKSVNILYDVTVGITDKKFSDYSCLLHPACI